MTITLTRKEELELWAESAINSLQRPEPDESICQVPRQLGKGYERIIEVYPNVWLTIADYEYHDDVLVKIPEWNHPLQFSVSLLGNVADDTLISGAGVQRSWTGETLKCQRTVCFDIHMPPELLGTFFPTVDGEIPSEFSLFARGNDWQTMLFLKKTAAIHSVAQQIISCPYQGISKRMFLQTRVQELIRLQLTPIITDLGGVQLQPRFRAGTVEKIYQAREILLSRLENPPSLLELAQMVGVSDRTLQRGFQQLFGNTVFSYLTDRRMERAERWLREGNRTVLEVSLMTGYSNPTHFSAAFKRKFGISPSQCLLGKKSV
ncbi:helix-turn-helix transcriptional regulator [Tolypothrix sp. VBCCA 56010]|uniref:helix-turn-helix transcriptional regulator n=1 Tax=Tolypothrix sp. VBCCA 56010 TaxID=3137731 RepID=UPI003D7F0F48